MESLKKGKVLIVDDERSILRFLERNFQKLNFTTQISDSPENALEVFDLSFDLALIDVNMPGKNGVDLMLELIKMNPYSKFVIMTASPSMNLGIEAIKKGAFDFICKPFDMNQLNQIVVNGIHLKKLEEENNQLRQTNEPPLSLLELIGESKAIHEVKQLVKKAARTRATVLIQGESGTGKEVIANLIHKNSGIHEQPFVVVNCGAIPENLVESELFGYEKGAFTGANKQTIGKFEQAHGGTIFLDEIGDLSLEAQVKLLRVLQEKEITRVGGVERLKLNFRVIAATNRDLQRDVGEGKFREDLFYRLALFMIEMPPLRLRSGDVTLLAEHFIRKYCNIEGRATFSISNAAKSVLLNESWPGNIRQLENTIYRAILTQNIQAELKPKHLEILKLPKGKGEESIEFLPMTELERRNIENALKYFSGNILRVSKELGMSRVTLYRKIKEYGLNKGDQVSETSIGKSK